MARRPAQRNAALVTSGKPRVTSIPRAEYRPNPNRALFFRGTVNQELIDRMMPGIVKLQHESREPITVYIDSNGGSPIISNSILRLLKAPGMDHPDPCPLITVVTMRAASAAASFLCAGDYAVAYPDSYIHFHGIRRDYRNIPVTVEEASGAARDLKETNDRSAMSLARKCSERFFFRYVSLMDQFDELRKREPGISEKDCFVGMISKHLTHLGLEVIRRANVRFDRYHRLAERVLNVRGVSKQLELISENGLTNESYNRFQAETIKAIVAFEFKDNFKKDGWTFTSTGMAQVADDFFLLQEYFFQHDEEWIARFCEQWQISC